MGGSGSTRGRSYRESSSSGEAVARPMMSSSYTRARDIPERSWRLDGIPIDCVNPVLSFSKIDEDGNIILSSGLSLPIITSIESMLIKTEKGREMNKHEVNGILNYLQHSQRFKTLQFKYCLLPPYIPMHCMFNLISKNVKVFWMPYGPHEGYYILNLQSGRWMQAFGRSLHFPMKSIGDELTEAEYRQKMKSIGDELTEAEYRQKVTNFRHRYRDEPWQQTWIVSRGNRNLETE